MALPGFEDINPDLSDYELNTLLPKMLPAFQKKIGVENAVKGKDIAAGMKNGGFKCSEVRVRKIVNYIRKNDLVLGLMASSKGYYISDSPHEIGLYIMSLQGRINELKAVRERFQNYYSTLIKYDL